jgi:hypothetical protein
MGVAVLEDGAGGYRWEIRDDNGKLLRASNTSFELYEDAYASAEMAMAVMLEKAGITDRHFLSPMAPRIKEKFQRKSTKATAASLAEMASPLLADDIPFRGDVWENDNVIHFPEFRLIDPQTDLSEDRLARKEKLPTVGLAPKRVRKGRGGLSAKLTKLLKGAGIFDSIYDWTSSAFQSAKKKLGFEVRNDFSPSVRKLLQEKGSIPVTNILARRDPIQSMLNSALNFVSFGQWDKSRKDLHYDKMFHLGLEVTLATGERYTIEKNAVIEIHPPKPITADTEGRIVALSQPTSINKLLEGAKNMLGVNMFLYDPFTNNCQDFVMAMLKGNNLATPLVTAFVKQPLEAVVKDLPSITHTLAKGVTDVGAVFDRLTQGAGKGGKFEAQLRKVGIEPSSYLKEAQRRAKNAGLPHKVLGFADDGIHKLAIPDAEGRMVKFGRAGYKDHLIWSHLERAGKVPKGSADAKKNTFHKSHSAIKGDWKKNPFSPNNLALKVLW